MTYDASSTRAPGHPSGQGLSEDQKVELSRLERVRKPNALHAGMLRAWSKFNATEPERERIDRVLAKRGAK